MYYLALSHTSGRLEPTPSARSLFSSQYVEDHQHLDTAIQSNVVMLIYVELSVHHSQ